MEWTACGVVFACFLELYPAIDHIDHVKASQEFINKGLGNAACHEELPKTVRNGRGHRDKKSATPESVALF